MLSDILRKINKEKDKYDFDIINIVKGYSFNQKDMIEKIYRYYNSKFATGDVDADGDKKYFYNIVKNPCKVTTKAIDFDTKHIRILSADGSYPFRTWIFERDLKYWMKDKNFGKVLNRIFFELPIFGSVVLKIVKGVPYFVDLRNFIVEQSADTLNDANYIIEKHLYTPVEFRKIGRKMGWNDIETTITEHRKMDKPYIAVYERYGEIENTDNEGVKHYTYKRIYVADVGVDVKGFDGAITPHNGVILKEDEIDKHPYWEFHLEKIAGRWLGVGVVETLIDPQIRENEIANLQAKTSYWAALRLFQTRDQQIARNLMTDVRNGEVLKVDGEITQIDMTDRNLAFFNDETEKWLKNRDELSFSYDVQQGQRLPSGTPLGSAQLAAAMSNSYFAQIQENIALDVKQLLYDVIIPRFKQDATPEHLLRLVGEDLDTFNEVLINERATTILFTQLPKLPTKEEFDIMKAAEGEKIKTGKEKLVQIPSDFYEGIKYKIDIDITGESTDPNSSAQVEFAALQAITADPTILQDPMKKKILFGILEKQGVDISKFSSEKPMDMSQLVQNMPVKGAGGGVSRPISTPTSPVSKTL